MATKTFDEILVKHSENLGRYQIFLIILVNLPGIITAMHALSWPLLIEKSEFRCALPGEDTNSPFLPAHCNSSTDCDILQADACAKDCSLTLFNKSNERISAFEAFPFLRCNYEFANGLMKSTFFVGMLVGSLVAGILSDRFGRKPIFMAGLMGMTVVGLLSAFTENFWIFFVLRGLLGVSDFAIAMSPILCTEFLTPKYRKIVSLMLSVAFCIGQTLVGIEGYLITNYRYLLIATAFPSLLFISYYWLLPESPRWLVSRNRIEEAKSVMETAAKANGVVLPDDWHKELYLVEKEKRTGSLSSQIVELFQTREMFKRSFCNIFIWIVSSCSFYTVSLTPDALGVENRYLTFTLSAAIGTPSLFLLYATLDRFGRQKVNSACFLLSGITMVIYDNLGGLPTFVRLVVDITCRCALNAAFTVVYVYLPEMFPTPVRNTSFGLFSAISRVATISTMFFISSEKASILWKIMGVLCLAVVPVTMFLLPETAGVDLPETVDDVENGTNKKKKNECTS